MTRSARALVAATLTVAVVFLFVWPTATGVILGAMTFLWLADDNERTIGGMFWSMVGGAFLVTLPMQGFFSYEPSSTELYAAASTFIVILLYGMSPHSSQMQPRPNEPEPEHFDTETMFDPDGSVYDPDVEVLNIERER